MILYLDTSAYVRLYVREADHDRVWSAARSAAQIATHLIAYAEMRSALARMQRLGRLREAEVDSIRRTFEQDWRITLRILPTEVMIRFLCFLSFDRVLNRSAEKLGLRML